MMWHRADGWAWAYCPSCDDLDDGDYDVVRDHLVWWAPKGTPFLEWVLYECGGCGAVTSGYDRMGAPAERAQNSGAER